MHRTGFSLSLVIGSLLLLSPRACWSDMYSATTAYNKGDFGAAFKQFKELAELGEPGAQLDLAIMYAKGQGVDSNLALAYAWASLAGQNGKEKGTALAADLQPGLTPNSLKFAEELRAEFGQSALNARLLPHFLKDREYADHDPARLSKSGPIRYPPWAQSQGVQGQVYVEFVVAPDGHPRMPRILYAVPVHYFEDTVRDSVLKSLWLPARINGTPVATPKTTLYNFQMTSTTLEDYGGLGKLVDDTKKKAESGDPSAQMLYGMMLASLPQLKQSYGQALPWFLKAAQAGATYAQFQIGTALLSGRGCECESVKGEIWLQKAAQADEPNAQVSLAEYFLRENAGRETAAGALVWLERAEKQDSEAAKFLLASVLAATPDAGIRDPSRSLKLTDAVEKAYKHDPSFWEIRAAAYASSNDFRAASKTQEYAITQAKDLGWDLAPMQQRASLYKSQKSWTGNLLAF